MQGFAHPVPTCAPYKYSCFFFKQDTDRRRNSPSEAVVQSGDGREFPAKGVFQSEEGGRGRSLHDFAENSYLLKLRFVNTSPNATEGPCIVFSVFRNSLFLYLFS